MRSLLHPLKMWHQNYLAIEGPEKWRILKKGMLWLYMGREIMSLSSMKGKFFQAKFQMFNKKVSSSNQWLKVVSIGSGHKMKIFFSILSET